MDMTDIFERENSKIESNLKKLEDSTAHQPEDRSQLWKEVRDRIQRLNQVEEDNLYALLHTDPRSRKQAEKSRQDVRDLENLLREMDKTPITDKRFQYLIERLHGEFMSHRDWEKDTLFRLAREVLSPEQAEILARRVKSQIH
ncbi:MAG: hypothetical protein R2940_07030 [Syntrophotaleaceae bacterium]